MMEPDSKLTELEALARRIPPAKRAALLKSLAELFVENSDRYRPSQIVLFDRLFALLLADVSGDGAAALARRLAPLTNAPFATVNRLAQNDDIAVAEPVLMRSAAVDDAVLLEVARTGQQTHLLAIACRVRLKEPVVDLLVARGDDMVMRYVANNRGARLSPQSIDLLVARAQSDDALAALVRQRDDIPPQVLAQLRARTDTTAAG